MKKILSLLLAAGMALSSLSAQETEKKQYLPEAGDWAIGFDAKPILNYVGNIFNGNTNNTLSPLGGESSLDYGPTVSIMGKYMLTDNFAVRANLGVNVSNVTDRAYVRDDKAFFLNPLSQNKLVDSRLTKNMGMSLMAGVEYRVGEKRIQGVFGGGLLFAFQNESKSYTYGNAMTEINQRPSSEFGIFATDGGYYRTLKNWNSTADIYAGLALTAGVEYFVAPKVALGAEVSLCGYYKFGNQSYSQYEWYNDATEAVEIWTELNSPGNRGFHLATQNLGGSLYLSFYF
jgi:opacity protein-like surface antigen